MFFLKLRYFLFISFLCLSWPACAMEVAITVDDLPVSGPLPSDITRLSIADKMLAAFKKHHVENVYGFINGIGVSKKTDGLQVLQHWVQEGQLLGNHTYSHMNLNKAGVAAYIADIKKNDPILEQVMGNKDYRYFRYPFHAEGNTPEKREAVHQYLLNHHYRIAPATVDFNDFEWSAPYVRCLKRGNTSATSQLQHSFLAYALKALSASHALSQALFKRDIPYILIVHIGLIDADTMDKLLTAYEERGVKFISLQDALSDEAYKMDPAVVRDRYYAYLAKHSMRGVTVPASLTKIFASIGKPNLGAVCR